MTPPGRWPNEIADVRDEAALKVSSALMIVERSRNTGTMNRSDMTELAYLLADARGHLIYAGARIRLDKPPTT